MTHGQGGAADVARQSERDAEVVFAKLVEHPEGGSDFSNAFVVAAEGG